MRCAPVGLHCVGPEARRRHTLCAMRLPAALQDLFVSDVAYVGLNNTGKADSVGSVMQVFGKWPPSAWPHAMHAAVLQERPSGPIGTCLPGCPASRLR